MIIYLKNSKHLFKSRLRIRQAAINRKYQKCQNKASLTFSKISSIFNLNKFFNSDLLSFNFNKKFEVDKTFEEVLYQLNYQVSKLIQKKFT